MAVDTNTVLNDALNRSTGDQSVPAYPQYVEFVIPTGVQGNDALNNVMTNLQETGDVYVINPASATAQDPNAAAALATGDPDLRDLVKNNAAETERIVAQKALAEGKHLIRITDGTDLPAAQGIRESVAAAEGYSTTVQAGTGPRDVVFATRLSMEASRLQTAGASDLGTHLTTSDQQQADLDAAQAYIAGSKPGESPHVDRLGIFKNGNAAPDRSAVWGEGASNNRRTPENVFANFIDQSKNNSTAGSHYVNQTVRNLVENGINTPGLRTLLRKHSGQAGADAPWGSAKKGNFIQKFFNGSKGSQHKTPEAPQLRSQANTSSKKDPKRSA